jgi:hypothetical protein
MDITSIGFIAAGTFVLSGMMYVGIIVSNCSHHRKKKAKYQFSW